MDCETGNVYIGSRKLSEYILSFQTTIGHRVISVSLKDAAVKLENILIKGTKQEEGRVEEIEKDSRRGLFGSAMIQKEFSSWWKVLDRFMIHFNWNVQFEKGYFWRDEIPHQ